MFQYSRKGFGNLAILRYYNIEPTLTVLMSGKKLSGYRNIEMSKSNRNIQRPDIQKKEFWGPAV